MTADCTVTVYRGSRVENEYLDVEDLPAIIHYNIPATLREVIASPSLHVTPQGTGTKAVVRCVGRIVSLSMVDLLPGDRVVNEQTGATYQIENRTAIPLAGRGVRLDMIRISGEL